MASVSIVARREKAKDGLVPLYARCTHRGVVRRLSLSMKVKKSEWNRSKGRVRASHRQQQRVNRYLSRVEALGEDIIFELQTSDLEPTADRLKTKLQARLTEETADQDKTFTTFAEEAIERYQRRGQGATANRHGQWLRKLRRMRERQGHSPEIPFSDVSVRLIEDFRTYLFETEDLAHNTVAKHLKGMRTVLYQAMKEGLYPGADNPFQHITITEKPSEKTALTQKEFARLRQADVSGKVLEAQDMFVFSVLVQGIRVSDLLLLQKQNIVPSSRGERIGRLEYTMRKNGKSKSIRLVDDAREIVKRYWRPEAAEDTFLFPPMRGSGVDDIESDKARKKTASANASYNEKLKTLAEAAEIRKNLTTHVARHTFASMADSSGWSINEVNTALAHSSIRDTQRYLRSLNDDELDQSMEDLFGQ
jgi:integrase